MSNLPIFPFVAYAFNLKSKSLLKSWKFTPMVYSTNCMALAFVLRPLIHFDLILHVVWGRSSMSPSACSFPVVPAPFVEETISSPLKDLGTPVENQLTINVWVSFQAFNSIPLFYLSMLMLSSKFWNLEVWLLQLCCCSIHFLFFAINMLKFKKNFIEINTWSLFFIHLSIYLFILLESLFSVCLGIIAINPVPTTQLKR